MYGCENHSIFDMKRFSIKRKRIDNIWSIYILVLTFLQKKVRFNVVTFHLFVALQIFFGCIHHGTHSFSCSRYVDNLEQLLCYDENENNDSLNLALMQNTKNLWNNHYRRLSGYRCPSQSSYLCLR